MTSVPVGISRLSDNKYKRLYLKREGLFVDFWLYFWNVLEIYNILKNTKNILAQLLPKLLHPKEMLTEASKRSCFSTPFGNQRVEGFETLLMSARRHYFPLFRQIPDKLSWKKFALVTYEIFFCLLTRWLPMKSVPVAICSYSGNNFKPFYLKKKRYFVDFLWLFQNVHEI